jgi:hypothetical protein
MNPSGAAGIERMTGSIVVIRPCESARREDDGIFISADRIARRCPSRIR